MIYSLQIQITWKKYTKPLIWRKNHILRNLVWYVNLLGFRHTLRIRCYLSKTARDKKVDITHVGKPALCEKQTNHSAFTTIAVNHLLFLASCVDLDLKILKIIDRKGKNNAARDKEKNPRFKACDGHRRACWLSNARTVRNWVLKKPEELRPQSVVAKTC